MSQLPRRCGRQGKTVHLLEGTQYAFCTCGLSAIQPFCNGDHRGTDFKPIKFVAERTEEACFCLCKSTSQPPYCDGTHNHIE
ncbi:MAG: CDGSH iron-sulfur domain-containing protein [Planctomycetaceae bacterium]|nr:CDGSH iron-sulfur domain-containing protein [Planctomycetaceae bacterium]